MRFRSSRFPGFFCRAAVFGLLAAAALALDGCAASVAKERKASAAYNHGDLEGVLPADYDRVVDAARNAIADLDLRQISETRNAMNAAFIARSKTDKKIDISLTNAGDATNIKIRVGVFGDEQLSMSILDKMKARL